MANEINVYQVLRLPFLTEQPIKRQTAAVVRRLMPLIRDDAELNPAQAAEVAIAIHLIAKEDREPTDAETLAIVAFANSCG